jgi:hypothetical protein
VIVGQLTVDIGPAPSERRCNDCGMTVTRGQPDPCFGGPLPGVRFACCGHGEDYGYIAFENGVVVRPHRRGQLTVDDVTCHYGADEQNRNCRLPEQGSPRAAYARSGAAWAVAMLLSTGGHPAW